MPELARGVGLLDAATAVGGYRVVTAGGRELAGDSGLTFQGVEDGSLLTVAAASSIRHRRCYDDVAEAMAEVVERDLRAWDAASGRRTGLVAAGLLLGGGAAALGVQRGSQLAVGTAAVVAVALVVGAIVLSRVRHETATAVATAWTASGYAAVAGLLPVAHDRFLGPPLAAAGAGALVAGSVALLGMGEGRALVIPPVGSRRRPPGGRAGDARDGVRPRGRAGHRPGPGGHGGQRVPLAGRSAPPSTAGPAVRCDRGARRGSPGIDLARVATDARVAHEILVSLSATVGLLLLLVAPVAVSLGLAGTVLAVLAALVAMLRTRQYRNHAEVLVGLGSGVAGLVSVAVSVLWTAPRVAARHRLPSSRPSAAWCCSSRCCC